MFPVTLDTAKIRSLNMSRVLSGVGFVYFALQNLKDPAIANQVINADQFALDWQVTNQQLFGFLRQLEQREVLRITPAPLTINWSQQEITSINQAEALNLYRERVIDINAFVYYALVLTRPANQLQQVINPDIYAAAPWNIPVTDLQAALNTLSGRRNADQSPLFQIDLSNVSVTWLV